MGRLGLAGVRGAFSDPSRPRPNARPGGHCRRQEERRMPRRHVVVDQPQDLCVHQLGFIVDAALARPVQKHHQRITLRRVVGTRHEQSIGQRGAVGIAIDSLFQAALRHFRRRLARDPMRPSSPTPSRLRRLPNRFA